MGIEKEDDSKILGAIAFEKKEHWKQVIKGIMLLVFGMLTFILLYDPNKNGHLEAFYATLISATTVGYGDIAPSSNWAKVISAFVLPVLTAVFADFFGTELVGGGSKLSEQLNCDLSGWKDDFIADLKREKEATATESGEALQTATGVQEAQRLNSEALQTATGVQEAQRLNSEDEKNENLRKDKIQGLLNEKDAEIKKLKNEQKDLQEQKENFKKEAEESKEELKTLQKLQKQVAKDMVKNKSSAKQEQVMDKATVIQNEQMKKKVDETKKREEELISAQAELEEEMAKKREEEEKLKEARIAQEEL